MKEAKAFGRVDAPFLFVMVSQPSEGTIGWFWRQLHNCGILKSDVRIVYQIDEPPAGAGNKPLKAQLRSARARFEREIKKSKGQVVIPMGTEPFYALTGINEGIFDARGYLIRKNLFHPVPVEVWKQAGTYVNASKATGAAKGDPKMKWVKEATEPLLGDKFKGIVIPMFTLDHIRTEQFAVSPAFLEDLKRARRATDGTLQEIDKDFKFYVDNCAIQMPNGESVDSLDITLDDVKWGPVIAIDIETHGIDNEVIDLVSFSDSITTASIEWSESARVYVEKLFKLENRIFAIHNSPFDLPRLASNGVKIAPDVINKQVFDTMFGAVTLQPDLHKGLGRVASVYLDTSPWKTGSRKEDSHWRAMVLADPRKYSAKDALETAWVGKQEIAVMKALGVWNLFMGQGKYPGPGVMATIPELAEMTRVGLRVSKSGANHLCDRLERKLLRYLKLWTRMFPDISVTSPPQLRRLFYKQWGLPVQRSTEDSVSVDELALVRLGGFVKLNKDTVLNPGAWRDDPRANDRTFELLLRIRLSSKLLGTFVQPVMLNEENWVHPSYLPASKDDERGGKKMKNKGNTATGRLASYKPNIANQPKKVRILYVPDTDDMCFVQGDFKSAELYILAGKSGDAKLLADLNDDMHQINADRLGITRPTAKNVTYASQYLASPSKQSSMIQEQEHVWISADECLVISQGIWGYYTDATAYKQLLISLCEEKGYIQNSFGRIRFFHAGRAPSAVDFIPQSEVADILWCVLKPVAEMARRYGGRLVTTVYDSILCCVPAATRDQFAIEMKAIMEQRFDNIRPGFFIPVELEVGAPGGSWGELKKLEIE